MVYMPGTGAAAEASSSTSYFKCGLWLLQHSKSDMLRLPEHVAMRRAAHFAPYVAAGLSIIACQATPADAAPGLQQ